MLGIIRKNLYQMKWLLAFTAFVSVIFLFISILIGESMHCGNLHKYGFDIKIYGSLFFGIIQYLLPVPIFLTITILSVINGNDDANWTKYMYSLPVTSLTYVLSVYINYAIILIPTVLFNVLSLAILCPIFNADIKNNYYKLLLCVTTATWIFVCLLMPLYIIFKKYAFYIALAVFFVIFMIISWSMDSINPTTINKIFSLNRLCIILSIACVVLSCVSVFISYHFEERLTIKSQ